MKKLILFLGAWLLFYGSSFSQNCCTGDKPWAFIQMSDPQMGFMDANNSFTAETELVEQAIGIVNRLKPDFVVITGDLVNSYKNAEQIAEFKRLLTLFDKAIPVYLLPGNHDISGDIPASRETYIRNYGYDRFAFRHKGGLFAGINSTLIMNDAKPLEKEQYEWLEEELSGAGECRFRFVFSHHGIFLRDLDEKESYSNFKMPMRKKYLELLTEHGVDAVFSGHLHDNTYGKYGDMELVTIGSVGKPLGKGFHGMNLVRVYSDRYEYEYIALDDFPGKIEF